MDHQRSGTRTREFNPPLQPTFRIPDLHLDHQHAQIQPQVPAQRHKASHIQSKAPSEAHHRHRDSRALRPPDPERHRPSALEGILLLPSRASGERRRLPGVRRDVQLPASHGPGQLQPEARVASGCRAQAAAAGEGLRDERRGHHGADRQAAGAEPHIR